MNEYNNLEARLRAIHEVVASNRLTFPDWIAEQVARGNEDAKRYNQSGRQKTSKYYLVHITENTGGFEHTYRKPFKADNPGHLEQQIEDMCRDWYEGEFLAVEDMKYQFANGNAVLLDGWVEIPESHYDVLIKYL